MKKNYFVASILALIFLYSCGNKEATKKDIVKVEDATQEKKGPFQPFAYPVDLVKYKEILNEKLAERKANNKTAPAPVKELEKFLPESTQGYTMSGKPESKTFKDDSLSYSYANGYYRKSNDSLEIRIFDYNMDTEKFGAATGRWIGFSGKDTPEGKGDWLKWSGDISGWETLDKQSGEAQLSIAVGFRYFVMFTASGQKDTEMLKSIAKEMDLARLMQL